MGIISVMSLLFKVKDSILTGRDSIIAVLTPEGEVPMRHTSDEVKQRYLLGIIFEIIGLVVLVALLVPLFFVAYVCLGIFSYCKDTCCVVPEDDGCPYPPSPKLLSDHGSDCSSGLGNSSEIPNEGEGPDPMSEQGSNGPSFTILSFPCSVETNHGMLSLR
ncbi:putative membrane protein [Ehrlichia ruminantium]|uniref:Putative membrane protein n=2 Tax=Ehrlichia ruminantium TaxID=779 RepID=A0A170S4Y5_EHRRU|nr:putative membrane protein [Ehrlichia ruminantium]